MSKKTIIVTGGNRGIGKEICCQLSESGHKVILTSRSKSKGVKVSKEMNENVHVEELDVSDDKSVKQFVTAIKKKYKTIDVIINNAGIGVGNEGIEKANIKEIKEIMETNFYGPMRLNAHLIPLLDKSEEGRIINMSSGMGTLDDLTGGYAGYRLSKSGLNAQTILLANELHNKNIKVNAMCPGWVRTDMGGSNADRSVQKGAETAVWLATASNIPNGKFLRDKKVIPW